MARRQLFRLKMFLVLAVVISFHLVLITARTEKSTDFETNGQGLNQINHLRRIEIVPKRRRKTRKLMNIEEINDYPGSGANNRHTPHCSEC